MSLYKSEGKEATGKRTTVNKSNLHKSFNLMILNYSLIASFLSILLIFEFKINFFKSMRFL